MEPSDIRPVASIRTPLTAVNHTGEGHFLHFNQENPQEASKISLLSRRFESVFILAELVIICLFGGLITYNDTANFTENDADNISVRETLQSNYSNFTDIHVMIFIGFGFLIAYLRKHSWTSVAFNYLAAALTIQVYLLSYGLWVGIIREEWGFDIDLSSFIRADFCVAAVLITYGALVGKINHLQLLTIAIIETFFYALNEVFTQKYFKVLDVGGTITIHVFGAFFGLACAWVSLPEGTKDHPLNSSSYESNIFAAIGTLFLWIYWPSFNCVTAVTFKENHRAILATVLSLSGSCVATFITSALFRRGKFHMTDILNASLAGGVIIGANATLIKFPFLALLLGFFAGFISTVGYEVLSGFLLKRVKLHDTAGVLNLHGIPGVLGGLFSAIFVSQLTDAEINVLGSSGVSIETQVGYQFYALLFALGLALISGLVTGCLIKQRFFVGDSTILFSDPVFWDFDDISVDESNALQELSESRKGHHRE